MCSYMHAWKSNTPVSPCLARPTHLYTHTALPSTLFTKIQPRPIILSSPKPPRDTLELALTYHAKYHTPIQTSAPNQASDPSILPLPFFTITIWLVVKVSTIPHRKADRASLLPQLLKRVKVNLSVTEESVFEVSMYICIAYLSCAIKASKQAGRPEGASRAEQSK